MYNLKRGNGPYELALKDKVTLEADVVIEAGQVCMKDDTSGELILFEYTGVDVLTPAAGDAAKPTLIAERNSTDKDVTVAGNMYILIGNGVFQTDKVDVSATYAFGNTMVPSTATQGNLMEGTGTLGGEANQPCVGYYDGSDTFDVGSTTTACHNIIKVLPCGEVTVG